MLNKAHNIFSRLFNNENKGIYDLRMDNPPLFNAKKNQLLKRIRFIQKICFFYNFFCKTENAV